jgi:hypothetical protein
MNNLFAIVGTWIGRRLAYDAAIFPFHFRIRFDLL